MVWFWQVKAMLLGRERTLLVAAARLKLLNRTINSVLGSEVIREIQTNPKLQMQKVD